MASVKYRCHLCGATPIIAPLMRIPGTKKWKCKSANGCQARQKRKQASDRRNG